MGMSMRTPAAVLLAIILTASILLVVNSAPASAQSVPEFTLKLADHSYNVPPSTTTTTDPYTGKQTVTTQPGYHVENKTIDITIQNQQFLQPNDLTDLYYNIRVKGHFGENWTDLYYISNNTAQNSLPRQSASENTVVSVPQDYPAGGEIFSSSFGFWSWETSGWSDTQTLTIPADTLIPSPDEETQQIGLLLFILGLVITAIVVLSSVSLVLYFKKYHRDRNQ
jgi:hypothetical protein